MNVFKFRLQKRGNAPDEYEDAEAVDESAGRFAVADGATESSFAREWAAVLAKGFVGLPPLDRPSSWFRSSSENKRRCEVDWLPPLQDRWLNECGGRDLPWYAEMKFDQGAFATFLGIAFEQRKTRPQLEGRRSDVAIEQRKKRRRLEGRWSAVAVGDSCLFQIRNDRLLSKFPLHTSADFDNSPQLLGSRTPLEQAGKRVRVEDGRWRMGDVFMLATDALAQWFMRKNEAEETPWKLLLALKDKPQQQEAIEVWIDGLRDRHEIRNDDVTLIIIQK